MKTKTNKQTQTTKHLYYVSTDSGSHAEPFEFDSLAEALDDFGCPAIVTDADSFVAWLERVGGYGFIKIDGAIVAKVES